jgi:hypothetical protein
VNGLNKGTKTGRKEAKPDKKGHTSAAHTKHADRHTQLDKSVDCHTSYAALRYLILGSRDILFNACRSPLTHGPRQLCTISVSGETAFLFTRQFATRTNPLRPDIKALTH